MTRRIRRTQPGSEATVAAYQTIRTRYGLGHLAEHIETALDEAAGPYRLTPWERHERALCRGRFGVYDPDSPQQSAWLASVANRHVDDPVAA